LAALVLSTLGEASAASLSVTPHNVGGGTALVSRCDANGFQYRFSVNSSAQITLVSVGGIDVSCAGGILRLTLANGTTSVGQGTVTLPTAGFSGSIGVNISPTPQSDQVTTLYAAIDGQ
jgi:hypothetical protein